MQMPLWTLIVPVVSLPLAGAAFVWPPGSALAAICAIALCASVLASVHHAEVVAAQEGAALARSAIEPKETDPE